VRESCEFRISDDRSLLRLTCTITGSSYEQPWDGSEDAALALASEAAVDTADLIARTPVGFANSGGFVFVDESAEQIASA